MPRSVSVVSAIALAVLLGWSAAALEGVSAGQIAYSAYLPVVLGVVDAHKGKIWVESEPGVGTTFHLRFPFDPITAREG